MMATHSAQQVRDCMGRFSALETNVAIVTQTANRLDNEIFNHDGGDGLKTIVLTRFAADDQRHKSEKEFREQRDKETKEALLAHEKVIKTALDANNAEVANALTKENMKVGRRSVIWQIAGVFVSAAMVCVAILAIICSLYVSRHSSIDPPELLRRLQTEQTYHASNQPQDATSQFPTVR
jgi:hypothetical protein